MTYLVKLDWVCNHMSCGAEATHALFTGSHRLHGRFCDEHAASHKAILDERESNPKVYHLRPPPAAERNDDA